MMRLVITLVLILPVILVSAEQPPSLPRQKPDQHIPLSPRDALGTFQLDPQFTIELAAAEPDVVDPVCFCFDAKGDLYVVEMRGYPNGGKGEGKPNLAGRVRRLQDKDGDGYYETSSIFVDGLRFPCGITPWKDGFLIGDAPDLLFVADRSGTGKADVRQVLYSGFGNSNIQQMINGLQFHGDGWVYGCNGGNDSPVRSVEKPDLPPVQLRGMHFRFKPDVPGSLEATSGGGQYGLAVTQGGQWLTCTNSQHLRHIVLPHKYLQRSQGLTVSAVTLDIPDHGAAARVFRISPFEAWRVERTTQRAGSEDAKRFPTTELVPGGFITSACGLAVMESATFPSKYRGNVLVCDPANNLIHRDVLVPSGSTFRAERHDNNCEFLASTDTWFRPVFLANGPDGSVYVADFYREIIETPLSLPDDIKARWNLNSRERGRIWRIKPKNTTVTIKEKGTLHHLSLLKICDELTSPISWRRLTAQRLLVERGASEPEVVNKWKQLLDHPQPATTIAALQLLSSTRQIEPSFISTLLTKKDIHEDVAICLIKLAEEMRESPPELQQALVTLCHASSHVRFQLALSLGQLPVNVDDKLFILNLLLIHGKVDHWLETAILTSAAGLELELLHTQDEHRVSEQFLERLAQLCIKRYSLARLLRDVKLRERWTKQLSPSGLALLRGLGPEYARSINNLLPALIPFVKQQNSPIAHSAIGVLSYLPWKDTGPIFRELLRNQSTEQLPAMQALKAYQEPAVAEMILSLWPSLSPGVRREAQEVLLSSPPFVLILLDAAEHQKFAWRQLDLARREQLARSRNNEVRRRVIALQAKTPGSNRAQVVTRYEPALKQPGDAVLGKQLFVKHCGTCHQLDGLGHAVGPDLRSALGNKTANALLVDILDPNREVDPRYINYVIVTKTGRTITGMVQNESVNSITLKRAEGVEETVLRTEIDELQGTGKSLMPENLEEQLQPNDVANIIAYLLSTKTPK